MLYWGGSYLLACLAFLANPGTPFRLDYKTPGGALVLTADWYVLDTNTGNLTVVNPKVTDPTGQTIFAARRVEAHGLPLLNSANRRVLVEAKEAYARVRRRANGRFDFLDYLPKQNEQPSEMPFSVSLDHGHVVYVDETGPTPFTQEADVRNLQVDGVGQKWLASSRVSLKDVGELEAAVQNLPKEGVWVTGKTQVLELTRAFHAFREMPEGRKVAELRQLDASSFTVQGPFAVFVPTTARARIQSKLAAVVENFRYGSDYSANTARFEGAVDASGASGKLTAQNGGLDATFEGFATWSDGTRLKGNLTARATDMASLPRPLRAGLPKDLVVKGPVTYDGTLAYEPVDGLQMSGRGSASELVAYKESVVGPQADVSYTGGHLAVTTRAGRWRGSALAGSLAFDSRAKQMQGSLQLHDVNLAEVGRRFGVRRLSGRGNVEVALSGPVANPDAYLRAEGEGDYTFRDDLPVHHGRFKVAAALHDKKARIEQAYLVTRTGSFSASGSYDMRTQALALNAVGSGIDLGRYDPRFEGIGRFKGSLGGTLQKPHYKASAELFGLRVQNEFVPIVTADFVGDFKKVTAENLKAVKGVSQAEGQVTLTFKNMGLDGAFHANGVQLSDFLGDDYLASITMPDAKLSGSLKNPTVTASASAKDIVIKGGKIDSAEAQLTFTNGLLQVDDFQVKAGQGSLDGYLSYDVDKKSGQANFSAKQIALADFVPKDMGTTVTGLFSGEAGLTFDETGLKMGSGDGKLTDVFVNDTPFGNGVWKASGNGQKVTGSLGFGLLLERSVEFNDISYEPATQKIGGTVIVRHAEWGDLYKVVKPYITQIDPDWTSLIERSKANIGLAADISGTLGSPNFDNASLALDDINVGGGEQGKGGSIVANLNRHNELWTIDNLTWKDGPGLFDIKGTVQESGPVAINAEVHDFDLHFLSAAIPSLSNLQGQINATAEVTGPTKSPEIRAAVSTVPGHGIYSGHGAQTPENQLQFDLSEIYVAESHGQRGGISIENGKVNFGGYAANLNAHIPLEYPFTIPDRQITGELVLDKRPVGSIDQLAGVFDPKTSVGDVFGQLSLKGTKNDLALTGQLGLTAQKLVVAGTGSAFSNVELAAVLDKATEGRGSTLKIDTKGTSDAGGAFSGDVQTNLPRFGTLLDRLVKGEFDELLANSLTGQFTAQGLATKIAIGTDGKASGTLDGNLKIGGTVGEPSIAGPLTLANASLDMPSQLPAPGEGLMPAFSPVLDLTLKTDGVAKFKSSTADMDLSGQGTIAGTFRDLDVNATLRVRKGQLKLPTARVTLDPGGTIKPAFQIKEGESSARVDVELEGRTRVVATQFGQSAQRYDVRLGIRGDLLEDGGIALTATSDPPELSQDQILALLGQVSLIEGIASGVQAGNAEKEIRNALFGIAVPYLLDPLTSRIAGAVGLDYLTLDFNALEGATISFARTLSRDFVLQGSRQVSPQQVGVPAKYDLRLTYQFRFGRRGDRRRLNFSVGIDEIRPWKLAVEYGFRF